METQSVTISRDAARDLYRAYKQHKHYSTPVDHEIMRAYQLLAQGRLVIKALESITAAGLNAEGLPKLAIAPATAKEVTCRITRSGSATFDARPYRSYRNMDENRVIAERAYFNFPARSFKATAEHYHARALVPIVPLQHRPKRGLANYHILWEAEWRKVVPVDPFLIRRIGKADLWAVLAMWDLTEVERAALATRL